MSDETSSRVQDAQELGGAPPGAPAAPAPPPMKWIFVVVAIVAAAIWLAR